ncbi:hypothetical protein Tco_0117789 [Tanacetum coccineum]
MARVDVNTLTMEQYLALSRENQASGVVKPKIKGNVNFKIKIQFMRELREDTFSRNKDENAHDHIDRVLSIVGLFNILRVSKDAAMLRVFPFTLTGSAKRWVDRLAPGTINTWDLLKKAFIKRPGSGPIPEMRPAEALIAIQTMVDHSQKWHDGTTSRNIGSSSRMDGLAALVNKFAKDLTQTRIAPSTRKLNKWKRLDMGNSDEQLLLTEIMEEDKPWPKQLRNTSRKPL